MAAREETRRVLVTGGASGIGRAVAEDFLHQGCRVAVMDSDGEALRRLPAGSDGPTPVLLEADVADAAAVDDAFARIDKEWGGLDVLCNNAGISIRRSFVETTLDDWNRTLAVNLTGAFLVAQHAARRMSARSRGVIVNTASVSGMVGMPHYAAYNVSKAGLIELTKTMALELAPTVRVNAVCPGYVLTPMQRAEYTEAMLADCAAGVPLRRLGTPQEIAALISYLSSDAAGFVTGQSFVIDGGESAGGLASAV
jgi:NAD(P)-dependent dehydrogenase (short-subunit alcohol dehydrogenase family)